MEENNLFGYVAQDEMGGNGSFGNWHWGVNFDVRLKNIEYHQKGKNDDGKEVNAKVIMSFIEANAEGDDAVKKLTVYEPDENKQIGFDGKEYEKGSADFNKAYEKQAKTASRALCDIAECFYEGKTLSANVTKVQSQLAKEGKKFGFTEFANFIIKAIKSFKNWQDKPLDLFMQWSSKLSNKGNSYLEIPNANMGHFVCAHQEGEWEEEKVAYDHYKLFLKENGVKTRKQHPIARGNFKYFWDHNAEQVKMEEKKEKEDLFGETENKGGSEDINWDDFQ